MGIGVKELHYINADEFEVLVYVNMNKADGRRPKLLGPSRNPKGLNSIGTP